MLNHNFFLKIIRLYPTTILPLFVSRPILLHLVFVRDRLLVAGHLRGQFFGPQLFMFVTVFPVPLSQCSWQALPLSVVYHRLLCHQLQAYPRSMLLQSRLHLQATVPLSIINHHRLLLNQWDWAVHQLQRPFIDRIAVGPVPMRFLAAEHRYPVAPFHQSHRLAGHLVTCSWISINRMIM